jgi:hypothetical protein
MVQVPLSQTTWQSGPLPDQMGRPAAAAAGRAARPGAARVGRRQSPPGRATCQARPDEAGAAAGSLARVRLGLAARAAPDGKKES